MPVVDPFPPEDLAALRADEKDAILDAMLGMAWSDAEAQPEEVALLGRIAPHFTGADPEKLLAEYRPDVERVGRKIARSDLGPGATRPPLGARPRGRRVGRRRRVREGLLPPDPARVRRPRGAAKEARGPGARVPELTRPGTAAPLASGRGR